MPHAAAIYSHSFHKGVGGAWCARCAGTPEGGKEFCERLPFPEAMLFLDPGEPACMHGGARYNPCLPPPSVPCPPFTWHGSSQAYMHTHTLRRAPEPNVPGVMHGHAHP